MFNFTHNKLSVSISILIIVIIFSACENACEETLNNELIFPEAHEINVPSYVYQSITGDILVHGDEGYKFNLVDTLPATPVIGWDSVQTKLIISAIFSQPIQVVNGRIENLNKIVWIWHSGLENGKDGWVAFEEGRNISDGNLDNLSQPIPLTTSHQYYWGVWSWDESGIRVRYSSRQMTFYVK